MSATASGILLGVSADKMLHSYAFGGWLAQGFAAGGGSDRAAAVHLCADVGDAGLPSFLEVLGPAKGLTLLFMANMLGVALIVTTLISAQTALSLIFDARWRDFSVHTP